MTHNIPRIAQEPKAGAEGTRVGEVCVWNSNHSYQEDATVVVSNSRFFVPSLNQVTIDWSAGPAKMRKTRCGQAAGEKRADCASFELNDGGSQ